MSKKNSALSGAASGAAAGSSFGPWGMAIGAIAGGVLGNSLGQDDNSSSIYEEMMKEIQGIPLPILKEMNPTLYKQVVSINPQLEQSYSMSPSKMEGIALDPRMRQAQLNALAKLQNISDMDGKDAQFMADANRTQNDVNSNLRGNTLAIQQNLATRGMSGGMSEMVARNMEAQNAANRQAQMGLDIQSAAQQRALQALMNGAQLGGQMNQQDFNQQSQVAQAQDV